MDVWQGSEYANEYGCKILAKWLLMSAGKHRNKGVYWYEKVYALSTYSCLHCSQFPLFDFSNTKTVCRKLYLVPTKNLRKSHEILIYLSTANVQHIKYTKFGLLCCLLPLFSGISAVALILLLGVCESEQFHTAEYNKSQK